MIGLHKKGSLSRNGR